MGGPYEDITPYCPGWHKEYYWDALVSKWPCRRPSKFVFVNPPFSLAASFYLKALLEALTSGVPIVMLLPFKSFNTEQHRQLWLQVEQCLDASYKLEPPLTFSQVEKLPPADIVTLTINQ